MVRLDVLGRLAMHGVDGGEIRSVLAQPKRLALLVFLTVESERGLQRRDHLFGLFWPELSQAHARQALRQSLYVLRHALGDDVIAARGADEIGIATGTVQCDACAFERLVRERRFDDALSLSHGDFLAGFYVAGGSSELEQWIDATRDRLRGEAIDAAWRLATAASSRGEPREAARWGRFAMALAPTDERSLQRLVRLLDRQGDRAGAVRAYTEFAERLNTELEAEPSPETHALMEAIRHRTTVRELAVSGEHSAELPVAPAADRESAPDEARREAERAVARMTERGETGVATTSRARRRLAYVAATAALPVLVAASFLVWSSRPAHSATTSLAAERLYEQGLRTFYRSDAQSAIPLFHAALREDSTFAMAAYYAALAEQPTDGARSRRDLALALRLAGHVPDRERLLIRQAWAFLTNDPAQLPIAESLVTRYPTDAGGELALGRALEWRGDFLAAVPPLRRAIALDSLSLAGRSAWCRACDALDLLADDYISLDSLAGAERVTRWWTRLQPTSPRAWWRLESVLNREESYDAARAAARTAERLSPTGESDVIRRVIRDIRAGEFAKADRMLTDEAGNGNALQRGDALWWLVISLRNQGRLRAAAQVATLLVQNAASEPASFSEPSSVDGIAVAQVQFEMGHYHRAAALFDSIAHYAWHFTPAFPNGAPGLRARHMIWMTTHVATARAASGDTASLGALADSIGAWKVYSALFRDHLMDFYVRGLLLEARGDRDAAAAEFRRAAASPIDGYSRANFELGRILIAEGRARQAIPYLRAPLHGWLEASNYYLTYTELHALLGEAFDRAGEPDSALVHYDRALAAWRDADPLFAPRISAMRARVSALRRRSGRSL